MALNKKKKSSVAHGGNINSYSVFLFLGIITQKHLIAFNLNRFLQMLHTGRF